MPAETTHKSTPTVRTSDRSLPIALLRARETVMSPIRHMLQGAGITEQQWRVLRVLDEGGPADATEIAHRACILMPSLTRMLHVLEDKNYCVRGAHPTDKRRAIIAITRAGKAVLEANSDESDRIFATLEAEFGKKKLERLLELLNELAAARQGERS